jgi:hypothetical protein
MTHDAEALRLIDLLRSATQHDDWHWQFRASGLPACPLQHCWYRFDREADELPGRRESFAKDFYTEIGTAVHTVVQRWLGRLGVLYGDWRCPRCTDVVYRDRLGTARCDCGAETVYEELAFDGKPSGHCDGLIKLGELTPGEKDFAVLEVKTTSERRLDQVIKPQGPPLNYRLQATNYTYRLQQLGYNLVGVMFLFVPRDSPRKMHAIWVHPKRVTAINQAMLKEYEATVAALDSGDFSKLSGTCSKPEDGEGCPYRPNCFSPSAAKLFRDKARTFLPESEIIDPQFPEL